MPGYFCFFFAYEATRGALTPPGKTKDEIGAGRTVVAGWENRIGVLGGGLPVRLIRPVSLCVVVPLEPTGFR